MRLLSNYASQFALIHWLGDALLAVMFSAFFVILVWQLLYSEEKPE